MPHTSWINRSIEDLVIKDNDKMCVIDFWNQFYTQVCSDIEGFSNEAKSKNCEYKDEVLESVTESQG